MPEQPEDAVVELVKAIRARVDRESNPAASLTASNRLHIVAAYRERLEQYDADAVDDAIDEFEALLKLLDKAAATLERLHQSREAVIEECAKVADKSARLGRMYPADAGRAVSEAIARNIRVLKATPATDADTAGRRQCHLSTGGYRE